LHIVTLMLLMTIN